MKWWMRAIVVAAGIILLTGCSGGSGNGGEAKVIEITADDMRFDEQVISLEKGKAVKIVLHNQDTLVHDFSIDKIPAKVKESHSEGEHDMGKSIPDVHTSAAAHTSSYVEFTPTKVGTYTFYCMVAGHKEAGMKGALVVK